VSRTVVVGREHPRPVSSVRCPDPADPAPTRRGPGGPRRASGRPCTIVRHPNGVADTGTGRASSAMRVLIVDDEPLARVHMRSLLAGDGDVSEVVECANGLDAVSMIRAHRPDLVLLDVEMPGLDGFGVVRAVGVDAMPAVIFVTAHHRYASAALAVRAVDCVLKPVWGPRLTDAVRRAKAQIARG